MSMSDAPPATAPPLVANERLALRILSLLPPCPPQDRLRATSACRALRALAPQLPVYIDPLAAGRFDGIVATGDAADDVLTAFGDARLALVDDVIVGDGRCLTASGDAAVDGDVRLFGRWSVAVELAAPVVLAWRVRIPRNEMMGGESGAWRGAVTLGLARPAHFNAFEGGWSCRGQIACWERGSYVKFSVGEGEDDDDVDDDHDDVEVDDDDVEVDGDDDDDDDDAGDDEGPDDDDGDDCPIDDDADDDEGSEDDGGLEEKTVVLMLDPARRELIASVRGCGENSVKRKVLSAEEWPSRTERLVPFVCVDTEHFNGFEELDEGAAVLFEACSSSSSAVADQVAAFVANAAPPLTGPT